MAFLSEKLISASGGAEETDDDFNLVTGLYHFDGSNGGQNKTFLDSSSNSVSLTRGGSVSQGTFSPFSAEEGKWSASFDGTDDYLSIPTSDDFAFGTGDFTIEMWVFRTTTGMNFTYEGRKGGNANRILIYFNTSNQLVVSAGGTKTDSETFPTGEWVHIALVRSGTTGYLFKNGDQRQTWTIASDYSFLKPDDYLYIGTTNNLNNYWFGGFISNLRVLKGTALYTGSSYTVPTAPLTAVTNTKLLISCSNRFRDKSTSAHTITPVSTPKIQPFSPFAPSAAYDAAVNGGSGYFDGSGDYLRLPTSNDFDFSGSFTIEAWIYITDTSASRTVLGTCGNIGSRGGIYFGTSGTNFIFFQYITNSTLLSHAITTHQWNHVAGVRNGSVITLYINGTSVGSTTFSNSFSGDSAQGGVGGFYTNPQTAYFLGSMSDLRVVNGTAVYTSNFTPPTAPLTDITNTKLLLNYTNAAIFDQSGKTTALTLANAQLDTTVKKLGTASLELDHADDYIKIPTTTFVPFGSGDFTIECFVYHDSTPNGNGQGYFQLSNGYLNSQVRGPGAGAEGNNGKWTMFAGTTQYTHTGLPGTNTWYHVAMVRNSGTTKLYVDGTEYLSASDTTNYTDTYFIIGGWYNTDYLMDGYIDEFRITLKARYTSNFTAPTKEFLNL